MFSTLNHFDPANVVALIIVVATVSFYLGSRTRGVNEDISLSRTASSLRNALPSLRLRGPNEYGTLRRSIASPRKTLLPSLSSEQIAALPYPPNIIPGARDVETLYGSMRVYEWGPEDGRKVLLIHGDATPAPILAPIASRLVDNGCRVMIIGSFFLFSHTQGSLPTRFGW